MMYKIEDDEQNEEEIDDITSSDDEDDLYASSSLSPTVDTNLLMDKSCDSFTKSKLFKNLTNSKNFLDPLHTVLDKNNLLGMQLTDQLNRSTFQLPYFGLFSSQNKSLINQMNGTRLPTSSLDEDLTNEFNCHLCSYKSNNFTSYQLHLSNHCENKCPLCDYTAKTVRRLERHVKDFHSSSSSPITSADHLPIRNWSPSKSPIANGNDESSGETNGHVGLRSNELSNVNINNNDEINSTIDTTISSSNNQTNGLTSSSSKPRRYLCKQCNYIAHSKIDFWDHNKGHIKPEKQLKCNSCNFVTEYKHHLEYHIRNHYGSKPFKCSKCNYTCVNKSMLNSHMKSHSNVYQFQCKDCNYATKYCHSLKTHLRKLKHRPTAVLNLDGTVNPYQIIDVYGTRRGPRPKRKPKSASESPTHVTENDIPKELLKPEASQEPFSDSNTNLDKDTSPLVKVSSVLPHTPETSHNQLALSHSSNQLTCSPFNSHPDLPLINTFKDLMIHGSNNSEPPNPSNNQVLFWISSNLRMGVPFLCIPLAGQNSYLKSNHPKAIPPSPIEEISPLDLSRK